MSLGSSFSVEESVEVDRSDGSALELPVDDEVVEESRSRGAVVVEPLNTEPVDATASPAIVDSATSAPPQATNAKAIPATSVPGWTDWLLDMVRSGLCDKPHVNACVVALPTSLTVVSHGTGCFNARSDMCQLAERGPTDPTPISNLSVHVATTPPLVFSIFLPFRIGECPIIGLTAVGMSIDRWGGCDLRR